MDTMMETGDCFVQEEESAWNEEVDITQLCRICANPSEYLIPIFEGEGLEHELEKKIEKHLPIKVSRVDELPTNLCYQCASTLIAWHDMVVSFVEADDKLKAVIHSRSKVLHEKDSIAENDGNSKETITTSLTNNTVPVSKVQEPVTSDDADDAVEEEEMSSIKPEITENENDETTDTRFLKTEEESDYNDVDSDEELEDELLSDLESDEDYGTFYNCNICKATNMPLQDFLSHSKLHSKEEKKLALAKEVNCKIVREEAAKSAAASFGFRVQESLESSVTLYQCIVCGQGNLLLKDVQEHSTIHPQYIESNFCSLCQKQFPTQKTLNLHLGIHLDNNHLFCQYCNKEFETLYDLEDHEDQHYLSEYKCVDCRESFKTKELVVIHLRHAHSKDNTCLICDLEFKSDKALNKHFVFHTVVRAMKRVTPCFTCELCLKKYESKVSLQRHKLFIHNNRVPFICEHCGFFAFHEKPLSAHLEKNHVESEEKCVCFKCGPVDSTNNHTAGFLEGNFCKFCGSKFKSSMSLKRHYRSHGEVKSNNPLPENKQIHKASKLDSVFVCSRCGEIFMANDLCLTHLSYHVDSVLCDLCGKPFRNEFALNIHLNDVHVSKCHKRLDEMNTFPFKCEQCDLNFKLEFEFEDHCETHIIRYQCHFCFDEFSADTELQEHLNSHVEELHEVE